MAYNSTASGNTESLNVLIKRELGLIEQQSNLQQALDLAMFNLNQKDWQDLLHILHGQTKLQKWRKIKGMIKHQNYPIRWQLKIIKILYFHRK